MTGTMRGFGEAVVDARRASGGRTTDAHPALAQAPPERFAAAWCDVRGRMITDGDEACPFILMSVSKPFALALAVDALGRDAVLRLTGMTATGLTFNAPEAITNSPDGRTNPMVNPGAITVASLLDERAIRDGLSRFAGHPLVADSAMVDAIHASRARNRELAVLLDGRGLLGCPVEEALRRYTVASCLEVTVTDLARMGAVLARDGVDADGVRIVSPEAAATAVDAMALAGMYEATREWMDTAGLPAKSGIAGGLVMVAPGRGAAAAYSPPLDAAGNPVRAQVFARSLAAHLPAAGSG